MVGLIVICLVWGSTWLAIKLGLETTPRILAASLRFVVASALLLAIMRLKGTVIPREKDFWKLARILALNTFWKTIKRGRTLLLD